MTTVGARDGGSEGRRSEGRREGEGETEAAQNIIFLFHIFWFRKRIHEKNIFLMKIIFLMKNMFLI